MLVLDRRPVERIKIGDDIDLIILNIMGNQIKIGIEAPKNICVHRLEIYEGLQAEKRLTLNKITIND